MTNFALKTTMVLVAQSLLLACGAKSELAEDRVPKQAAPGTHICHLESVDEGVGKPEDRIKLRKMKNLCHEVDHLLEFWDEVNIEPLDGRRDFPPYVEEVRDQLKYLGLATLKSEEWRFGTIAWNLGGVEAGASYTLRNMDKLKSNFELYNEDEKLVLQRRFPNSLDQSHYKTIQKIHALTKEIISLSKEIDKSINPRPARWLHNP